MAENVQNEQTTSQWLERRSTVVYGRKHLDLGLNVASK